jgi:hypothetical protein
MNKKLILITVLILLLGLAFGVKYLNKGTAKPAGSKLAQETTVARSAYQGFGKLGAEPKPKAGSRFNRPLVKNKASMADLDQAIEANGQKQLKRGKSTAHSFQSEADPFAAFTAEEKVEYYRQMIGNLQGAEALSIRHGKALDMSILTQLSKDPALFDDFSRDLQDSLQEVPGAIDLTDNYRSVFDSALTAVLDEPVAIEGLQCGPVLCIARLTADSVEALTRYRTELFTQGEQLVWQVFGGAFHTDPETGRVEYQVVWSTNPRIIGATMSPPPEDGS